ncbi:hypothetical protein [Streptomyces sp. NPDC102462]|uniref:hypothetical protein n=1 Tax=Streptomyces sp. NPDC102462 TaxID=3366178 RepID=UPI00380B8073
MRSARGGRCLTLILALGLAGCVSAQPARHPDGTAPASPRVSVTDLATRSGAWPASQHLLETAVSRLVRRCLDAHGFDVPDGDPPPLPAPEDEAAAIDLPGRRDHGYGLGADRDGSPPRQAQERYYERLPSREQQRYDIALFGQKADRVTLGVGGRQTVGMPGKGCEADGRRAVAGSLALWARIVYIPDQYDNRLAEQVAQAPTYRAALAAWRRCMASRGYRYDTPSAAQSALQEQYQRNGATAAVRRQEKAVAVADGECAAQVHLPSTALAARRTSVASLSTADHRSLEDLASHRAAAVRRAAAVLAELSSGPAPRPHPQ